MVGERGIRLTLVALALLLIPVAVFAQASSGIAGVVKDTTGAVLPGVTVEASSPALIERVRSAITDGEGQYKLVGLQPGTYAVTFTLPGFSAVRREGIELSAAFTAAVNADMRVGSLDETITVSGASPIVDVQNVVQRTVVSNEIITALPTARNFEGVAQTIPGMTVGRITRPSGQDVGGLSGERQALLIHGSKQNDFNTFLEGLSVNALNSNWSSSSYTINPAEVQEFSYNLGAASAEYSSGGALVNMIPRTGSNTYAGMFFGNFSRPSFQADNLAGSGTSPNKMEKLWDIDPAYGGPIKKDKLWFFTAGRYFGLSETVANDYYAKDPAAFIYEPDLSRPAVDDTWNRHIGLRLTWQATAKNKFAVYGQHQRRAATHYQITSTVTPEAIASMFNPVNHFVQGSWDAPVTSRLFLQAGILLNNFHSDALPQVDPPIAPTALSITESSTGLLYGAARSYTRTIQHSNHFRAAASYITGSHAFKVGTTFSTGYRPLSQFTLGDLNLTVLNGVPRSVTQWATPFTFREDLNAMVGIYGQDQWTVRRLTVNAGIRFDHHNESVPAQDEPAGRFVPARSFAVVKDVPNWNDVSPRLGVAFDVFGNGRTAVKATLNRYVANEALDFARANNPVNTSINSATRTWTDTNGNRYPDCNFAILTANGECLQVNNLNFGKPTATTTYDDAIRAGWNIRPGNWETTVGVQQQLLPKIGANVSYFRRWYTNFTATDNLSVTPGDFDPYCIVAPSDPRLPNGGGYQVCGLYDVNTAKFGQVNNLVTTAATFGKQFEHYNGVDVTLNARLAGSAVVSGGINVGRTEFSNCFTIDSPQQNLNCDVKPPFQTQVRLLATYPLPWQFLVSGTFQSLAGPEITASYTATSAQISPSLGRNLSSGANGTAVIPLISPGTMYGERLYQIDGRISKIVRVRRVKTQVNLDLFNLLNANPVLTLNQTFGPAWQQPNYVLPGRLMKLGVQVDF
jgi:hypothetical protein